MGELFIKTYQPGDEGKPTFRMEIGHEDGSVPSPGAVLAHMLWVGLDIAKKNGIKDPRAYFHEMIDKDVTLKCEELS